MHPLPSKIAMNHVQLIYPSGLEGHDLEVLFPSVLGNSQYLETNQHHHLRTVTHRLYR